LGCVTGRIALLTFARMAISEENNFPSGKYPIPTPNRSFSERSKPPLFPRYRILPEESCPKRYDLDRVELNMWVDLCSGMH
jgi:hypothetical protein